MPWAQNEMIEAVHTCWARAVKSCAVCRNLLLSVSVHDVASAAHAQATRTALSTGTASQQPISTSRAQLQQALPQAARALRVPASAQASAQTGADHWSAGQRRLPAARGAGGGGQRVPQAAGTGPLQVRLGSRLVGRPWHAGVTPLHCCRLLGVPRDAAYEEVQDARNFLFEVLIARLLACLPRCRLLSIWPLQSYRKHAPSREAIELAFDRVLKASYETRQKHGFKPPKMGRRTDAAARPVRKGLRSPLQPAGSTVGVDNRECSAAAHAGAAADQPAGAQRARHHADQRRLHLPGHGRLVSRQLYSC